MPSRRDILKATGGLVLATAGSWLASHAHAAAAILGPAELPERNASLVDSRSGARQVAADQEKPEAAEPLRPRPRDLRGARNP